VTSAACTSDGGSMCAATLEVIIGEGWPSLAETMRTGTPGGQHSHHPEKREARNRRATWVIVADADGDEPT